MPLEILLKQIDQTADENAAVIRENFRRIQQYLNDIGADKIKNLNVYVQSSITGASVSAFNRSETFDVSVNNQTSFTLTEVPLDPASSSAMYVNGAKMNYGDHYTISGSEATFYPGNAGFQLEVNNEFGQPDRIIIFYMV